MSLEKAFEKIKPHAKKGSRIQVVIAVGKEMVEAVEKTKAKGVKTGDHEPCVDCGNTEFIRTGVCLTCIVCGSSAGCS